MFNTILICIEPQCIALLCIAFLAIALQGIALLGMVQPQQKDPNFFANVRTCPLTDFIDFLGLKFIFKSGTLKALIALYERSYDALWEET